MLHLNAISGLTQAKIDNCSSTRILFVTKGLTLKRNRKNGMATWC